MAPSNENGLKVEAMKRRNFIRIFVAVCVIGICAAIWRHSQFIDPADVDYKSVIGPPPAAGTEQEKQDLLRVLVLQAIRSPADVDRAQSEADFSPFVFSRVLGPWFTAENLPQTWALLREVMNETGGVVDPAKKFYARPRPFVVNSEVRPCVKREESFSYPSGHATHAMVLALVLSEIFPDERESLIDEAKSVGMDRVRGGVHYPTDIEAGEKLARAIFDRMRQSDAFKDQLEQAKFECESHAGTRSSTSRATSDKA
jgi:acid phosphatase (class A)